MKKSKILVALLLAFVMVFGVVALVACDKGGDDDAIELVLWAPGGAHTFYKKWAEKWAKDYKDSQGRTYTVSLGTMDEGSAPETLIAAPTNGADVFLFADDQIEDLYINEVLADLGTGAVAQDVTARNSESSVLSATFDGKLLAYPMQADNTFFLYYNPSMLSDTDVETWDGLFAKLAQINQGKEINEHVTASFSYGTPWYQAAWFFTFGGKIDKTSETFSNPEIGLKALQAAYEFSKYNDLEFLDDNPTPTTRLANGTLAAAVSGTWIYQGTIKEMVDRGELKMTVLPKVKLSNSEDYVQMKSFISCKLVGVNAYGQYVEASHSLANYITNYDVQLAKALELGAGPSNMEAAAKPEVAALPTVKVVAEQAKFAEPQAPVPSTIWKALETCVNSVNASTTGGNYFNPDGTPKTSGNYLLTDLLTAMHNAIFPQ